MKTIKYIQHILIAVLLGFGITACSSEEDFASKGSANMAITVGGFPAFGDSATTRAIGTPDAGKKAWENGDVLLVKMEFFSDAAKTTSLSITTDKLTYSGTEWKQSGQLLWPGTAEAATLTAWYAPGYELSADGTLTLSDGKTAGTSEVLKSAAVDVTTANNSANITFPATRAYSRLRVVADPKKEVTLTAATFTPVGATEALGTNTIKATADTNGNVFFYGSWTADASLKVTSVIGGADFTLAEKTGLAVSIPGTSYALNAPTPPYKGPLANLDESVYNEWIITDATPDIAAIKSKLTSVYNADNSRRIKLTVENATSIGDRAFYGCGALKSVQLPLATSIGGSAFSGCDALESVQLPMAASIGDGAFRGCSLLKSVTALLPASIGNEAFRDCKALASIDLSKAISIGDYAFGGCSQLNSVIAPLATSIGDDAFSGCSLLKSVTAPLAASIGDNVFRDCEVLESIDLPKATSIGEQAFQGCSLLKSVTAPLATSIGYNAFFRCEVLESVQLPLATSIGGAAFFSCSLLTSLDLPLATSIGDRAFQDCLALTTLTFGAPITSWEGNVLLGSVGLSPSAQITLTLSADQKQMVWNSGSKVWEATTEPFTDWGTGKRFCGDDGARLYTFKEIKKAPAQ